MSNASDLIGNLSPQQLAFLSRKLQQAAGRTRGGVARIEPQQPGHALVTSFVQDRFWFLQQMDARSAAYNVNFMFSIPSACEPSSLQSACELIASRHEILRTTFHEKDGIPIPVVVPAFSTPLECFDLTSLPKTERQGRLSEIAEWATQRPFDLESSPPWRIVLIQVGDTQHVVVLVMHHIITDGSSLKIFAAELEAILTSAARKVSPPLPRLPVQYSDFAAWQRQSIERSQMSSHLDYWCSQLAGMPDTILTEQLSSGGRSPGAILVGNCRSTASGIQRLARDHKTTKFVVLLSALFAVLHRFSGMMDFGIGTPVSLRSGSEVQDLIGCFVNTVIIRARLHPGTTFTELIARIRETILDAFQHQELPFDLLVRDQMRSRQTRSPLFQVMFALIEEGPSPDANTWDDFGKQDRERIPTHSKFDLGLSVLQRGEELKTVWEYRPHVIGHDAVRRLQEQFDALLVSVLKAPDQEIVPVVSPPCGSLDQVCLKGHDRNHPPSTLHELFQLQVARTPEQVAVTMGDQELTYAELDSRARSLAARLNADAQNETRIGIFMRRSPELIVAELAVLMAGAAFVPLDPTYPELRLANIVTDAGLSDIIVDSDLAEKISGLANCKITKVPDEISAETVAFSPRVLSGESAAYIIYTSGSTGTPRGVVVTHHAVVNHMLWMSAEFPLRSDDRIFQRTSISFDPSIWEIFLPLSCGARLVLSTVRGADYESLAEEVRKERITVLQLVPALFQQLVLNGLLRDCVHLRLLFCGGEALEMRWVNTFLKENGASLHNLYGPTETTIDATCWRCVHRPESPVAPIGKPIDNTQLLVLNDAMTPVAPGTPGELYIGGSGLARGYFGSPRLTAERFLPLPDASSPGSRMYKTGDRVRLSDDQVLEFLGRVDDQIKFHGYRIEPSEIEVALGNHPDVARAVVAIDKSAAKDGNLIAYVLFRAGAHPVADDLCRFLRGRLPGHCIPNIFVRLEELPLLPNGKTDKRQLSGLSGTRLPFRNTSRDPRSELESDLVEIWKELLQTDVVGVTDDFFALGGHSLLATQAVSRIREHFGVTLPLVAVFDSPTIESLAQQLHLQLSTPDSSYASDGTLQREHTSQEPGQLGT